MIEDVVRTLREGATVTSPPLAVVKGNVPNLDGVLLVSDQLPGSGLSPAGLQGAGGVAYLVDSFVTLNDFTNKALRVAGFPASPLFNQWLQTQ